VIKLDVEDAEIQALQGARCVLSSREVVVLYEDHGQGPSCHISKFLFENFDFDIFYCDEQNTLTRMHSVGDVRNVKKSVFTGYNLCACSRNSVFSRILADHSR